MVAPPKSLTLGIFEVLICSRWSAVIIDKIFLFSTRFWGLQKSTRFIPVQSCQPKRSATNKNVFDSWKRRKCYLLQRRLWAIIWRKRYSWSWYSGFTEFPEQLLSKPKHRVPVPNRSKCQNVSHRKSKFYCQWIGSFWFWAVRSLHFVTEL